ncbi:MAG: hypothetical protein B7Y99_13055 [Caulobacterales bacterium 32-69-10]|nr:MAG: hypothetical protein B7Y99_13055 [Caulobacterales bacterium 32-69-10]
MKRFFIVAAATAALALGACTTATPYQPLQRGTNVSGGYTERQIEANRWQVSFSGNSLTNRRTVESYLLFRAAELTQQNGYDWFSVVDRNTDRDTRVYADPYFNSWGMWGPSWRMFGPGFGGGWSNWGYWGGWGPGFGPGWGGWGGGMDYRQVTRFEANAEIFLGRGPKPTNDTRAFTAADVIQRLGPTIVRPTAG